MKGALTFVVREGDGATARDVLAKVGGLARAAADEGRAFVGGRRLTPDEPLAPGDEVEVHAARAAPSLAVTILASKKGLVVADKPAGLPTTADRRGSASLLDAIASMRGVDVATLHAGSRLDVGVSGAVLVATTTRATKALADAREAGEVHRLYVALAAGELDGEGAWDAPIGEARAPGGRSLPAAHGHRERKAVTRWRAVARAPGVTLLALTPVTGRSHQLRVHAALAGLPLLGDRDHGGPRQLALAGGKVVPCGDRVALHALRVEVASLDVAAESPVPDAMRALWSAVGGDPAAWAALEPPR
ncbi:MAG TPA: RluA family pseudouridine synthase [Byssovorax sp.]